MAHKNAGQQIHEVEVEGLGYAYGRQELALREISFRLEAGTTLGLAGANGSGKSTLLTLLAGLARPTAGCLRVGPYRSPGQTRELRDATGLVLQSTELQILGTTVGEDLRLGLSADDHDAHRRADALASAFDLDSLLERPVDNLSGGQKRRLCLAAILVRQPRVLLLDEPFSGLDDPGILEMRRVLAEQRQAGQTQIVATHNLETVADLVDLWAVLANGRLEAFGTAEEVFPVARRYGVRPPCWWQAGFGLKPWDWDPGGANGAA